MTADIDERVARLYGLPLEKFTPERNSLAAELRAAGAHADAAAVKALRKPSAAAWAVNQLVRAEPDLVEALLGAGGELRQAHRQATSGRGAEQLRAAAEAERTAVEALLARAPEVLGRMVSAALAESIRNTLHAASSDDEARERVACGTVVSELRPVGLGPAGTARGRGASAARSAAGDSRRARDVKAAVAAERAHQREVDAAERALDRANEAYTRARETAEAAAARAKEARKRLRDARASLAEATRIRNQLNRE